MPGNKKKQINSSPTIKLPLAFFLGRPWNPQFGFGHMMSPLLLRTGDSISRVSVGSGASSDSPQNRHFLAASNTSSAQDGHILVARLTGRSAASWISSALGAGGKGGIAGARTASASFPGMRITPSQSGHLVRLPAALSGALKRLPQDSQATGIGTS